ncbi:PREDICTED: unconventional myosin-IXb-like isoform X1 [Cyprinodon variegatus]|uniref:unconventional myosin-IXb-like isoform X1 n=1 Tax=Cyprinodon variegatus TaxID=28743 RepID=UPI0007426921|nr:PREDICTED: unconventional myosin-IXb-like isoform X1 [Cyprinodon variegatus]
MSTTDGPGTPEPDEESRVVQIYPRLPLETEAYCPLQVGIKDTAKTVIHNAVVTLDLDSSQNYSLLEVRKEGSEEKLLQDGDSILPRVLLWPSETQRWHPRSQGFYFILQQSNNGAKQVGTSKEDSDDLCNLSSVTEEAVLQVLRQRFLEHKIYTYISNILIAINPNKFLPLYYNPKYVKLYENQPLGKLSPHIFAIADVAFRTMLNRQVNQCIMISGESGSGKTESSSYLIHCLTTLSRGTYSGGLERAILGAGPVLEAFGNAETAENNNSSRFGKFFQLIYLESGVIRGAFVEKFLLENSRLVSRGPNERNYHVFYCLLMGASKDEQKEFRLLKLEDYVYLNQGQLQLNDVDDLKQEYKRLKQAMEMVGFLAPTKKRIFSVLSAILLLGNVTYNLSNDTQVLEAGPTEVLSSLSHLLMVKKEHLVKTLTKKTVVTAASAVDAPYTLQEANSARDSLAKSLYSALFDWIVLHINHAMLNRRDMEESVSCLSIGVLDMFGFENLQKNSFEQLCINYACEKQQFYINQNIFKFKQEDYVSEGITWQNIDFTDNSDCIQLISDKTMGLFSLMNEESSLPHSQDEAMLEKFKRHHQNNSRFVVSPNKEATFTIEHYAGKVNYQVKDFQQKNTEHMRPEFASLLRSSKHSLLHHLVASSPGALFRWGILRATIRIISVFKKLLRQRAEQTAARQGQRRSLTSIKRRSSYLERLSGGLQTLDFSFDRSDEQSLDLFEDIFVNYEKRKNNRGSRQKQLIPKTLMNLRSLHHIVGLTKHNKTRKLIVPPNRPADPPTVSAQFQSSLDKLIETIEKAEPFFIFCFRSNTEKKSLHFDDEVVLNQIRYTGILQMIHMQKSSYTAKYTFEEFVKKFRILLPKGATAAPEVITVLFEKMGLEKASYQIGKNKVYLKEKERQLLQVTLNKEVMQRIVTLQRWFRTCLIRMHFLQKRDATMIIQRSWREFFEKQNRAATVMQMAWRTSLKESIEEEMENKEGSSSQRRVSLEKRRLRWQQSPDINVGMNQESDPVNSQTSQQDQSRQKEEGRGSPHLLNRPFSVPLDSTAGSSPCINPSESRRERYSEDELTDLSSPEIARKRNEFYRKGKSMSADELSGSSGCESSSNTRQERVRLRKPKKHKRRLAYARSGLVYNFGGSKESEYWQFPLPPISPLLPGLKNSASSMDFRALNSQVKMQSELDCSRYSLPATGGTDNQSSNQALTTPERMWFLGRFLKKRAQKSSGSCESLSDKNATLPRLSPQSYQTNSNNSKVPRNTTVRISRATRALQADASLDREITDPNELRNLDEFLGNQVNELRTRIKDLSPTENMFLSATMEFRENIKDMYSLKKPQVCYKSLMNGYRNTVTALAKLTNESEVSLVVNLFQSVLDGFIRAEIKRAESEPAKSSKTTTTKRRWRNEKCLDNPLDHLFSTYQKNIMQSCDLCGSYIWVMEKAYMCSACKLICHKKCLKKVITDCSTRCARQDDSVPGSLHFGVQVCVLTSKVHPVPKVMELLLMHVELNGLYTEGIYRKSGAACRARELYQILETDPEVANLDNYPIHTITGLVKRWLRELPDPLMTFSLYSDFLHAVELPEKPDRIKAVYQKVDELPPANYNTLERLIFHLVKVAKEEKHNKMTPSSLAIVFAPCILRSPDFIDPFLSMKDVPKTTLCVEILINEQLRRYNEKMQEIHELENAEAEAVNILRLRRQNTVCEQQSQLDAPHPVQSEESDDNIIERIKSIKQFKAALASGLNELEQELSDSEILDSASSVSSDSLDQLGGIDSEGKLTKSSKTLKPECPAKPADLAQRFRRRIAEAQMEQRQITSGQNTDVTHSTRPLPRQEISSSDDTQQTTSKTLNGSFDDLDIPYIDEVED